MQDRTDDAEGEATVTFVSDRSNTTVRVPLIAGRKQTLLAAARQCGVPILFNCEVGGCAACLVRVTPATAETQPVALTESEEFLLQVIAELAEPGWNCGDPAPRSRELRLACQYVIGHGEIVVTYANSLGGS